MKTIVVILKDYPVSWADFGRRRNFQRYSDQDMLYVFSRNHHDDESLNGEAKNDIIGLSSIDLPKDDHKLVKEFSNFYNCFGNQKISYFKDMKIFIVIQKDSSRINFIF